MASYNLQSVTLLTSNLMLTISHTELDTGSRNINAIDTDVEAPSGDYSVPVIAIEQPSSTMEST